MQHLSQKGGKLRLVDASAQAPLRFSEVEQCFANKFMEFGDIVRPSIRKLPLRVCPYFLIGV